MASASPGGDGIPARKVGRRGFNVGGGFTVGDKLFIACAPWRSPSRHLGSGPPLRAQDAVVELVHDTVAECRALLASLSEERLEREAQATHERERLAYLGERGWNSDRVARRLTEHEEWLTRCDRWKARASDTLERFKLVLQRPQ
ncbi:MAG TPA: hypothetical protein VLA05_06200 [Coriobacteriia bacterium]|nr:hypothetical protein [Coriobacteriia bacterium]